MIRYRKTLGGWRTVWREEEGSSLVEVVVATVLLVVVLIPLTATGIYLLKARQNERHLMALTMGQQLMEDTLYHRAYRDSMFVFGDGRWEAERQVTRQGNQIVIEVNVYRRFVTEPLVQLMTIRLRP